MEAAAFRLFLVFVVGLVAYATVALNSPPLLAFAAGVVGGAVLCAFLRED
jgi:hypothetical protein